MNMHARVTHVGENPMLGRCPNCGEGNKAKVGRQLFNAVFVLQCMRCGMFRTGFPFPAMAMLYSLSAKR